jgi:hydroxymethylpyrimidine pyrophosphatase-like HAD family hydrolase
VLDGSVAVTSSSTEALLEMSARGVTKASALAALADRAGIPSADVVAFGDMPNDLPMLAWAGRAVAVANAHPEVLALADEVTASNDEDGVAVVLERMVGSS